MSKKLEQSREGCLFSAKSSQDEIALQINTFFYYDQDQSLEQITYQDCLLAPAPSYKCKYIKKMVDKFERIGFGSVQPVPMTLFATWEVEKSSPICIPRYYILLRNL